MLDRIEALESSVKYLEAIVKNTNKRKAVVDDDDTELMPDRSRGSSRGYHEEPATQVASSKRRPARSAARK